MDYTITLTDTQKKSLEYVTPDIDDWITTAATHRADLAMFDIIALNTEHCNKNGIAIAIGEAAQVAQAYSLGIIKTAAERNAASS
tara:strand:+ start:495 stop:749 length:255 start_codon:yes stop_codon:yes gene_type:complete